MDEQTVEQVQAPSEVRAMTPTDALGLLSTITVILHPNVTLTMKDEQGEQQLIGATDRRLHLTVQNALEVLSRFIASNVSPV